LIFFPWSRCREETEREGLRGAAVAGLVSLANARTELTLARSKSGPQGKGGGGYGDGGGLDDGGGAVADLENIGKRPLMN